MSQGKDDVVDVDNHDPHFDPIVTLLPVETKTLEEDEEECLCLRGKLYRFDKTCLPGPGVVGHGEWKERGTGDLKILKHREKGTFRVLMRRDKTLKVCANHAILPQMVLKPNCGSDRAWVWSTPADFSDEEATPELLAVRFATRELGKKFKDIFEDAKTAMLLVSEFNKIKLDELETEKDKSGREEEEPSTPKPSDGGGSPRPASEESREVEAEKSTSRACGEDSKVQGNAKLDSEQKKTGDCGSSVVEAKNPST